MENDTPTTAADRRVSVTMTLPPGLLGRIDEAAAASLRNRGNYIEAMFTALFADEDAAATETTTTGEG